MRHRCANCTETYRVSESSSLYPQSFCSKGCEVEAVVISRAEHGFMAALGSLGLREELYQEVH